MENLMKYHFSNRYTDIFNRKGLTGKLCHVEGVIRTAVAIAEFQRSPVDMDLLKVLAEHHDDGRVDQYERLGKFWDTEIPHQELGAERLEKFLEEHGLPMDGECILMKDVMLYHGKPNMIDDLPEESKLYVKIITAADDFENARSCVSYLVKEVQNDEKGYGTENQTTFGEYADFIWRCYTNGTRTDPKTGEWFDKNKHCQTYADYVIFAATLMTVCIKQYASIAKTALMQPGYGYTSILDGFKVTFEKTLEPELAAKAYQVMVNMI